MVRKIVTAMLMSVCVSACATNARDYYEPAQGEYNEHEMSGYQIQPENTYVRECRSDGTHCRRVRVYRESDYRYERQQPRPDYDDDAALSEHR